MGIIRKYIPAEEKFINKEGKLEYSKKKNKKPANLKGNQEKPSRPLVHLQKQICFNNKIS